jgi:hypothetical protein
MNSLLSHFAPDLHRLAPGLNSGFVHETVQRAIAGGGPLPSAAAAAENHLAEKDGDVEDAIREVVYHHVSAAGVEGFVTNLGGLVTMAAMIPLNVTGLALLQSRMVAEIAHLRGYDLTDNRVRDAILLCMLGEGTVRELVKEHKVPGAPMVLATAPAYDPELDRIIAAEVTSALVSRVLGKKATTAVIRRFPGVSGVWGATADSVSTWHVGRYAARELRSRQVSEVSGQRARRRLRG